MIQNQWYAILPSSAIKNGQILAVKRMDIDLALFRTQSGILSCVTDLCTHRGASFKDGKIEGECICCPFHGLQYDIQGSCTFAPSLGKSSKADLSRFNLKHHIVKEAHGIVYFWYGEGEPSKRLPFFDAIVNDRIVYSEIRDEWNAFYSRCIENQLDVLHLPFIHYNTIGKGNKTLVNGPKVIFENHSLITSARNEVDTGQVPRKADDCDVGDIYLRFMFPNIWMNHISDKVQVMIYFAPVDQENTVLYIRFYSCITKNHLLNTIIASGGKIANRIIERQDKRVVVTQRPKKSTYYSKENLLPGDGPIIEYRRLRQELINQQVPQELE